MKQWRKKKVVLDITINKNQIIFNLVFLETGEIRQKRRSIDWLMKRIFFYELRTWEKNRGEIIEYERQ